MSDIEQRARQMPVPVDDERAPGGGWLVWTVISAVVGVLLWMVVGRWV